MDFTADTYQLHFPTDRPFVYVDSARGERLMELFVLSGVHAAHGRDDTTRIGAWESAAGLSASDQPASDQPGETVFTLRAESSIWRAKTYRLRCGPRRFSYEIEVEGSGRLEGVDYFGGYFSGSLRWGTGFFWSGQHFSEGFNPEPNTTEVYTFPAAGGSAINLNGVPLPARDDWFFTPPPFCFAMHAADGWWAMGVEARPGYNLFSEYTYHGRQNAFHLSLAYDSCTTVAGVYRLPAIGFDFAGDEYSAIEAHTDQLRRAGLVPSTPVVEKPNWWHGPIWCGWGSQCYVSSLEKGHAPGYARQDLYEGFLQSLEQKDLRPGIVVLDDKWQSTYGENCVDAKKWPDLPGFVARQHQLGRKVLLWLKAWDPEALPVSECITNAAGLPVAVDPTNPAYEQHLRASVRQMISPSGYDADGFKIDFSARIPSGPGLCMHGSLWGLELMRRYLEIIYSETKQVKPDALVMTHTPHPYLADVVDMIRLNDINTGKNINKAMVHRARIARLACPSAIIDTDNWPVTDRASWRSYLQLQPRLGVPSLYYSTHIDSTGEPIEAEDYQLIRAAWAEYGVVANTMPLAKTSP